MVRLASNFKLVLFLSILFFNFVIVSEVSAEEEKKYLRDISEIERVLDEQKKLVDGAESVLKEIDKRKSWIIFIIGTDYQKVDELQKTVEENNKKLDYFQGVLDQVQDRAEQEKIAGAIEGIRDFNAQMEEKIRDQKERFSLLGWFFSLFDKY